MTAPTTSRPSEPPHIEGGRRRLVAGTDRAAIGTLSPGERVAIEGTAGPDGGLQTAPDGTDCVFWQ